MHCWGRRDPEQTCTEGGALRNSLSLSLSLSLCVCVCVAGISHTICVCSFVFCCISSLLCVFSRRLFFLSELYVNIFLHFNHRQIYTYSRFTLSLTQTRTHNTHYFVFFACPRCQTRSTRRAYYYDFCSIERSGAFKTGAVFGPNLMT